GVETVSSSWAWVKVPMRRKKQIKKSRFIDMKYFQHGLPATLFLRISLYDRGGACETTRLVGESRKHQEWSGGSRVRQPGLEKPRCLGCRSGSPPRRPPMCGPPGPNRISPGKDSATAAAPRNLVR